MSEPEAIACTLDPEARRRRQEALQSGLLGRVLEARELADGWTLALPIASEEEARAFVAFEEDCCSFAQYAVRREDAADRVWLEIRGPEGTREFVARNLPPRLLAPGPVRLARRWGGLGVGTGILALLLCEVPILLGVAGAGALGMGLEVAGAVALCGGAALLAWAALRGRHHNTA